MSSWAGQGCSGRGLQPALRPAGRNPREVRGWCERPEKRRQALGNTSKKQALLFVELLGQADHRASAAPLPARGFRCSWGKRESRARGEQSGGLAEMSEDWPTPRGPAEAFFCLLSSGF